MCLAKEFPAAVRTLPTVKFPLEFKFSLRWFKFLLDTAHRSSLFNTLRFRNLPLFSSCEHEKTNLFVYISFKDAVIISDNIE
jgi:hypothetical protein